MSDLLMRATRVVGVIREGGVGRKSSAGVNIRYRQVITVRDETIVYREPDEAFRAASLST